MAFSLSRMLANADTCNAPEFETSFRLAKANEGWRNKFNIGPAGMRRGCRQLFVPWSKLATRDLSTQTQASGAFTVGTDIPIGIQASLRPTSLLFKLPVTVLENCQGEVILPRISTGAVPSNLNELQSVASPDVAFGAANAGPQRMSCQAVFSRQLLAQSVNSSIDRVLTQELCRAISYQIDSQILVGTGVAGQALGILNQNATSQNTYVAANGFGQIMAAQKQLEDGFIDSENAYWLLSTATAKVWRTLLKSTSTAHFILDGDGCVNDIPAYVTSFIPGSSDQTVLADWTQLVFASFGEGIDIIYDPYTLASRGEIILTANIYYQSFIRRPQTFVISTNAGSIFTS
jgi:HK97 family phage major capsid protein